MDNLVLEVNDYLAINKAKIEINKINVIGGINGSGKSTLSKVFYSFLKGNSTKRRDYALQNILDDMNIIIDELNYEGNDYNLPSHLLINDGNEYILNKIHEIFEIHVKHCELAKIKLSEINKEMNGIVNDIIKILVNSYCSKNDLNIIYESKKEHGSDGHDMSSLYPKEVIKDIQEYENNFLWYLVFISFIRTVEMYETPEDCFRNMSEFFLSEEMRKISNELHKLDYLEEQGDYFSNFCQFCHLSNFNIMNYNLGEKIDRFFGEDSSDVSRDAVEEILSKEYVLSNHELIFAAPYYFNYDFMFYINSDGSKIDAYDYLFNNFIDSICYVDNVSLMDLSLKYKFFHSEDLLKDLFHQWNRDLNLNQDVINILEKIENIMKGSFNTPFQRFSTRNIKKGDMKIPDQHISSGIKQIGIIQLLLLNNKLKKDGYLIIDEPEVNLHPDWQFKFAEILVILAKDLNITIYLNSHSPFFIESIDAFTEFYDMQDKINYYLAEESEAEGKYDFTKIPSDELYRIYDNLGNAYDLINQLRLRKRLEK